MTEHTNVGSEMHTHTHRHKHMGHTHVNPYQQALEAHEWQGKSRETHR